MLERAGLGVAMGKSDDAIKARADVVIGDNEAPPIADFIRQRLLAWRLHPEGRGKSGARSVDERAQRSVWLRFAVRARASASVIRRSTSVG